MATIHLTFTGRPDPVEQLEIVRLNVATKKGTEERRAMGMAFLPDSGANVTAIRPMDLRALNMARTELACVSPAPLPPALADGSTHSLRPIGVFRGALHFSPAHTVMQCDIWVVEGLAQPILSRKACFELGILKSDYLRGGRSQS